MGFWKLVKNFVERRNKGESKEAHDGGMNGNSTHNTSYEVHETIKRKKNAFREMFDQKRIKIITNNEKQVCETKLNQSYSCTRWYLLS